VPFLKNLLFFWPNFIILQVQNYHICKDGG
jgi:hypothetical protein